MMSNFNFTCKFLWTALSLYPRDGSVGLERRVLSIQGHLARGYAGSNVAVFPLQVRNRAKNAPHSRQYIYIVCMYRHVYTTLNIFRHLALMWTPCWLLCSPITLVSTGIINYCLLVEYLHVYQPTKWSEEQFWVELILLKLLMVCEPTTYFTIHTFSQVKCVVNYTSNKSFWANVINYACIIYYADTEIVFNVIAHCFVAHRVCGISLISWPSAQIGVGAEG